VSGTQKFFTDGGAYERQMGRWSRLVGEKFLDWLDLPKGLRCLDVGCGNGAFTESLIAHGAPGSVMALDPSEDQVAFARQRAGVALAEFRVGDAQVLPFDDNSYDAALMALVVSFLPDPAKAANEMARVVRPGGWVAAYMWDIPGGGSPIAPLNRAARSLGLSPPSTASAPASRMEAMQELWRKAGLTPVDSCVIRISITYSNFDDFWESYAQPIGPIGVLINSLSPAGKEQMRARAREQLPTAADGSVTYEAFANAVKGRVPA
jgi:ubiquinone/menaquinone biosynthesis C-methylase UbiE